MSVRYPTHGEMKRMAHISIARKHASGKITLRAYMVDIACLGIINTAYRYNLSEDYYVNHIEQMQIDDISLKKIS